MTRGTGEQLWGYARDGGHEAQLLRREVPRMHHAAQLGRVLLRQLGRGVAARARHARPRRVEQPHHHLAQRRVGEAPALGAARRAAGEQRRVLWVGQPLLASLVEHALLDRHRPLELGRVLRLPRVELGALPSASSSSASAAVRAVLHPARKRHAVAQREEPLDLVELQLRAPAEHRQHLAARIVAQRAVRRVLEVEVQRDDVDARVTLQRVAARAAQVAQSALAPRQQRQHPAHQRRAHTAAVAAGGVVAVFVRRATVDLDVVPHRRVHLRRRARERRRQPATAARAPVVAERETKVGARRERRVQQRRIRLSDQLRQGLTAR